MAVQEKSFVESHFLGSVADTAAGLEYAAPDFGSEPEPASAEATAEQNAAVMALANRASRQTLDGWWLASITGAELSLTPEKIVGSIVRCRRGNSSPIIGYDPVSHRVLTRSGHVYSLGMPEAAFAARARAVLRRMGF
jgi:hypothetical protein